MILSLLKLWKKRKKHCPEIIYFQFAFFFVSMSCLYKSKMLIKNLDLLKNFSLPWKKKKNQIFNSDSFNKIQLTREVTNFFFIKSLSKQSSSDYLEHIKELLLVRSRHWPYILRCLFDESSTLSSTGTRLLV